MKIRKKFLKRFVWTLVPLTLIFVGIVSTFYFSEIKKAETLREARGTLNVYIGKQAIARRLKSIIADLMILSQHDFFSKMPADGVLSVDHLAADLLLFVKEKRDYDQIRYLDETGREVVRVNFNSGQPEIVAKDRLQDKSNRYYFKEAFELNQWEVFFSPLDLNVEQGKIEVPHKPMIRLGTPVFDGQGRKRGIVLVNYFGREILSDYAVATANFADHMMVLNSDGYWLHHPDPGMEWGFMLDRQKRFSTFFPDAWERISGAESGRFLNGDGFFVFDTVYPLGRSEEFEYGGDGAGAAHQHYYWKSVAHVPIAAIEAATRDTLAGLFGIAGPLYLVLVLGGLLLSYAQTQRAEAASAVRRKNRSLELLKDISAAANQAATIDDVMGKCLKTVCSHAGWPVGHYYALAEDGSDELASTGIWHLDHPDRFENCRKMIGKRRFAPGTGLAGRVLSSGEPAAIADVTRDPDFAGADCAENVGIRGAFAFPLMVGETVSGVLEFYSEKAIELDPEMQKVMAQVGIQLGRVVERERAQAEINALAMTDQLTGLANRNQFNQRFDESLMLARREKKLLALMMIDLDRFKPVNDTFGHPVGDALLQNVAAIFKKFSRETDVVVRFGGDEFAILMVHPNGREAVAGIAHRIVDEIGKPMTIMGHEIRVGSSVGISLYPANADDREALIRKADLALYEAKNAGRGDYRFYRPDMLGEAPTGPSERPPGAEAERRILRSA